MNSIKIGKHSSGLQGQLWIGTLTVTIIAFLLVMCKIFLHMNNQEEIDLHSIAGEDVTSHEIPEFDLNWG